MSLNKSVVYYLASPYSHPDKTIMQQRYEDVNEAGAILCHLGYTIIEPIAMCHSKSLKYTLPTGYEYWKNRDRTFVKLSGGLIILLLDGWRESVGVTDEVKYAKELNKEVHAYTLQQLRDMAPDFNRREDTNYLAILLGALR